MTNVANSRRISVAAGALGLLTLLPVFLLIFGAVIASNLAGAETPPRHDAGLETAWRTVTIVGALAYGVLYAACGWRSGAAWRRCRGSLAVLAAYAALVWAWMPSGNFLRQASLHGILYALGNHLTEIGYIVLLMAYSAVLVRGIVRAGRPSPG